jgi:MFS family permease
MTSSIICIVLEVVIWTVHDLVTNAVLYAIIGILLGPMYPVVMMVIIDVLPPELQAGTIGWCASLGQAGSAIMPL